MIRAAVAAIGVCVLSLALAAPAGAVTEFVPVAGSPLNVGSVTNVATGNFNGDGHQDIAAITFSNQVGSIKVLLGNGSGGFTQSTSITIENPQWIAARDLDGDGRTDLAVAGSQSGVPAYYVLLGNGDGTFTAANPGGTTVSGGAPISIAIGKLNGDSFPDLAMLTDTSQAPGVHVLLGDGSGGFSEPAGSPYTTTTRQQSSIALGKLNGDAVDDVGISALSGPPPNFENDAAFLNDGSGGLSVASGSPFFQSSTRDARVMVLDDFNNDGKQDLAVSAEHTNAIGVLLGNGDGSFTAPATSSFSVGLDPWGLAAGDVNGDGNQDLVAGDADSNAVDLLLGDGSGGFSRARTGPFSTGGTNPVSVALADFNGDGKLDVVAATGNGAAVMLYNQRLPAAPTIGAMSPSSPSPSTSVVVSGAAEGDTVQVFSGASCNTPLGSGSASAFASPGIVVSVPANSTTTLTAGTTDAQGSSSCSAPVTYVSDSVPPAPPTFTASSPVSPSNDTTPQLQGSAESGSIVRVYDNPSCSGSPLGIGGASQFGSGILTVTVPPDVSTTLHATATDAAGNPSACSTSSLTYLEDSTPPTAPSGLDTLPSSPSSDAQPQVTGSAEPGSTVRIFTTASCSGPPAATGTAAAFGGGGIPVNLTSDGTTTFRATATDQAGNTSPCSSGSVAYSLDTTAPPPPVLSGTDPASPSNLNQVSIRGLAQPGSTVTLFANHVCAGFPLLSGTAAGLASPGLALTLPDDSTTTFSALATDSVGNTSACSAPISYVEDSRPPETFVDGLHVSRRHRATVTFSSDDPAATFACRIDQRAFGECTSPVTTGRLSHGRHTFQVESVDAAGNSDPTPASRELVVHRR